MIIGVVLASALTLAASGPSGQMAAARAEFDRQLFDYPSARFRDVRAKVGNDGSTWICGFVNSKNRMGAYAGWKVFLVTSPPEIRVSIDDIVATAVCESTTVKLSGPDRSSELAYKP